MIRIRQSSFDLALKQLGFAKKYVFEKYQDETDYWELELKTYDKTQKYYLLYFCDGHSKLHIARKTEAKSFHYVSKYEFLEDRTHDQKALEEYLKIVERLKERGYELM